MNRDPSRPVDHFLATCPAGTCTFVVDEDTQDICSAPAEYVTRLRTWEPDDPPGFVCVEHAAVIRTWPQLESIQTCRAAS